MPTFSERASEPVVALSLEPPLLADLLRQQLSDRGLAVASLSTSRRAHVVVVNGPGPPGVEADIVVRLDDSLGVLPATVEIEAGDVGASRVVDIDGVEGLLDVLVALTSESDRS